MTEPTRFRARCGHCRHPATFTMQVCDPDRICAVCYNCHAHHRIGDVATELPKDPELPPTLSLPFKPGGRTQ